MSRPKPVLLLILDGWGEREDPTDNAIAQAQLPNWRGLLCDCPHTLVHTEGRHVGLPDGQMGNSEVGHMSNCITPTTFTPCALKSAAIAAEPRRPTSSAA